MLSQYDITSYYTINNNRLVLAISGSDHHSYRPDRKIVRYRRYITFQMAEVAIVERLFPKILCRIEWLWYYIVKPYYYLNWLTGYVSRRRYMLLFIIHICSFFNDQYKKILVNELGKVNILLSTRLLWILSIYNFEMGNLGLMELFNEYT